jgi:hypothetical protein
MKVTSVLGHLMELEFEQGFNNWRTVPYVALFTAPVRKQVGPWGGDVTSSVMAQYGSEANLCWPVAPLAAGRLGVLSCHARPSEL